MKILNSYELLPMSTIEHTIKPLIIDCFNIRKIEVLGPKHAKTCEIVLGKVEFGPFSSKNGPKWPKRPQNKNWPKNEMRPLYHAVFRA